MWMPLHYVSVELWYIPISLAGVFILTSDIKNLLEESNMLSPFSPVNEP